MKPIKQFKIGSRAFFDGIEGFATKDYDELCVMDKFPFDNTNSLHGNGFHGKDVFFFRNMNKEGFIEDTRKSPLPMSAGKFLVPEFADYIGFTIDDLKGLEDVFDRMDEEHEYEKDIYKAYIENGGFYLTEGQKQCAYKKYLEKKAKK